MIKLTIRTPEIVKNATEIVKTWQRDFSGIPAQCVRGQFLFSGDIVIETPNETISGLNRFFPYCESMWQDKFKQIEIFVTGPILFSDTNQISFTRTILYLTHFNCRLSVHGITSFEINEVQKVKRWREYYDLEQFNTDLKACSLDFALDEDPSSQKQEL